MPTPVKTVSITDFQGGINWNADAFQLRQNEVSDALNVDFDPRGGFAMREGVDSTNSGDALGATPRALWQYHTDDVATSQVIAQTGNTIEYSANTGSTFTSAGTGAPWNVTVNGTMRAATGNNLNYIQRNSDQTCIRWNGATGVQLSDTATAYNEDLTSPGAARAPKAVCIRLHKNYMFHGNIDASAGSTPEDGAFRRSRIRWSHPGFYEDYRRQDYIDVGKGDGDFITGLVSWNENLYIFKNKSVWELRGYDAGSFDLVNISRTVGAVSQGAIAQGDEGIYFFSYPSGLQLFDGKEIRDLFNPLLPVINGQIPFDNTPVLDNTAVTKVTVGYIDQRCWVSFPTTTSSGVNAHTLVFDPRLAPNGGWTSYDLALNAYLAYSPPGSLTTWLATQDNAYVVELLAGTASDVFTTGDATNIESYVITRWYDLGNSALTKRWKSPTFVLDDDQTYTLTVQSFRDYDFTAPTREFEVAVMSDAAGGLWDTDLWDAFVWGGAARGSQEIVKASRLGRAVAVCMKIAGPETSVLWAVNSATLRYVPKRIR